MATKLMEEGGDVRALEMATTSALAATAGALAGHWVGVSGAVKGWVAAARGGEHALPRRPALTGGMAAATVATALSMSGKARFGSPAEVLALAGWACSVALLGSVDGRAGVVPTPLVRAATAWSALSLVAAGWHTGDLGAATAAGAACAVAFAFAAYGAWSLLRPRCLGFGDARLSLLVGLGTGTCSPGLALAVVSAAPLAAAVFATSRDLAQAGKRQAGARDRGVPLGPFLAIAGIAGVVSSAY